MGLALLASIFRNCSENQKSNKWTFWEIKARNKLLINCIHANKKHIKAIWNVLFAAEVINFRNSQEKFWQRNEKKNCNNNETHWALKIQFQEHRADCRITKSNIVTSLVFQMRSFSIYFMKFDTKNEKLNWIFLLFFFPDLHSVEFPFQNQIT